MIFHGNAVNFAAIKVTGTEGPRVGRLKVWLCMFVELKRSRFEEAARMIKCTQAVIHNTIK